MNTPFISILLSTLFLNCFLISNVTSSYAEQKIIPVPDLRPHKNVLVIAPIVHPAMESIFSGFKETLIALYPDTTVTCANAMGDNALLQTLIRQAEAQKVDLIAPIGTGTTRMTLALAPTRTVVALAAQLEAPVIQAEHKRLTAVLDEFDPALHLQFLHAVLPNIKKITLLYNPQNEKVFSEIKTLKAAAEALSITLILREVTNASEVYALSNQLPNDTEALFILKDHLLASAAATLHKLAIKRHIPFIAADDGSVKNGAAFGLGVEERQTGVSGAKLAYALFSGTTPSDLPILPPNDLCLFINKEACMKQSIDSLKLVEAAQAFAYTAITL